MDLARAYSGARTPGCSPTRRSASRFPSKVTNATTVRMSEVWTTRWVMEQRARHLLRFPSSTCVLVGGHQPPRKAAVQEANPIAWAGVYAAPRGPYNGLSFIDDYLGRCSPRPDSYLAWSGSVPTIVLGQR